MRRWQRLFGLTVIAATVLGATSTTQAVPLGGPIYGAGNKEGFEEYALGTEDETYNANWTTIEGKARIRVNNDKPWAGAKNLYVTGGDLGISYDLVPDIQALDPTKNALNGTDDDPLRQQFSMFSKNSNSDRRFADFFVEMSLGDVHAPAMDSDEVLPVIAFGWIRGISKLRGEDSTITPWYFDGMNWNNLGNTDQLAKWNVLLTDIFSDTVKIDNLKDDPGLPVRFMDRKYLGAFDTISLRSVNNAAKERSVDDIFLVGGVMVSEASLLSDLTGNGFVDFEDLTVLLANWNKDVTAAEGNLVAPTSTVVNFEDLTVLLADWTGPAPAGSPEAALGTAAVPEPSTLLLALLAALGITGCGSRRRRVR